MGPVCDSVRPHRWQPTRLPDPWDSPGKNAGVCCGRSQRQTQLGCPSLSVLLAAEVVIMWSWGCDQPSLGVAMSSDWPTSLQGNCYHILLTLTTRSLSDLGKGWGTGGYCPLLW